MNQTAQEFPLISRLFSAKTMTPLLFWGERVIFWSLLLSFITINMKSVFLRQTAIPIYMAPLSAPFSVQSHVTAATNLYNLGFIQSAKRELMIAQDLLTRGSNRVLGASNDPLTLMKSWDDAPKQLTQEYLYWKTITEEKPDYRDGFIYAASYAYQLGKVSEANSFLDTVYSLDPNFRLISIPKK